MNNHNYLTYAVYSVGDKDFIARAMKGCFASTAFLQGDAEYSEILGTKFKALFGDDGVIGDTSKHHIRRLASDAEFERLYAESCECFKFLDAVINSVNELYPTLIYAKKLNVQRNLLHLDVYGRLHQSYPEYTVEDFVSDIINS